ncbi:hypothetical protein [Pseudoclavibacter helvolus]|uniref:Uncharacterized protein n=1 Tax=Pseudoclavibacter helvolus TaxID=255205 RepID=A0A7W4URZ8_9MICO|nr:hypothetical protein [Pseudoclavibacter helvolus]MBB2959545.1 hypothetical protein [Pseudoclavibacter helvolus]
MLELITPTATLTADTEVELASRWAALENGGDWEVDVIPFVEHSTVWAYVEALELVRDGHVDDHTLTATMAGAR